MRPKKKRDWLLPVPLEWVSEGDRTLDARGHNPVLYHLSYAHHMPPALHVYARRDRSVSLVLR